VEETSLLHFVEEEKTFLRRRANNACARTKDLVVVFVCFLSRLETNGFVVCVERFLRDDDSRTPTEPTCTVVGGFVFGASPTRRR
jgi:hypothetical protein